MKRQLAIILILVGLIPSTLVAEDALRKTVIHRNAYGTPVYEAVYELTKVKGKPVFQLVESYVYGPFAYRCMAPSYVDHGGVKLRAYLQRPTLCFVPPGYKVCLQRAHVYHHGSPVLPYLYAGRRDRSCLTQIPDFKQPVFYRQAPLIPASVR